MLSLHRGREASWQRPRMVMFMSQSRSKSAANIAARGQKRSRGREVAAAPAADLRSRTAGGKFRPFAQGHAAEQSATCLQSYLQWAGFMSGAQDGNFGFGAYFADDKPSDANDAPSSAWMIEYTWTPSRRG
jgi:hypothetical protein